MRYINAIDDIFRQFTGPRFSVRFWNYRENQYGTGSRKVFTLVFENETALKRLLSQGAIGFGESYMSGDIRIEGDIDAYMRLRHQFKQVKPSAALLGASVIARLTTPKSTSDQIAYHYDLGNDFFELFLDDATMSYSCGLYHTGKESLAAAQQNKLKLAGEWIGKPKGAAILDIGSGWGGFAAYGAKKYKWNITGLTLSRAQLAYSKKLIAKEKLEGFVKFQYRDMLSGLPDIKYDAIVILESLEHVPKAKLKEFFVHLYDLLKPGGSIYLQFTGRYKIGRVDDWTLKYVFPGGYLPAIGEVVSYSGEAGLRMEQLDVDTNAYIRTLSEWISRIKSHKEEITAMHGESFYRLWELWTHGARAAFEVESMSLYRVKLTRHR